MRNLKFKYLKARNVLCFGPEGIEIDFLSYGNVVVIKGQNLDDINQQTGLPGSNGSGKCLGINTPVLMFDGTKTMSQDIRVGDLLMGDDSTPRRVLSTIRGVDQLYEVRPKKGLSYVVNSDHVLSLKNSDIKHDKYNAGDAPVNISVKDYLEKSKTWKDVFRGYRTGVDFPVQAVRIDPYILGLWLGDDTTGVTSITTADDEIESAFRKEALRRGLGLRCRRKKAESTLCRTCRAGHLNGGECVRTNAIMSSKIWQGTGLRPSSQELDVKVAEKLNWPVSPRTSVDICDEGRWNCHANSIQHNLESYGIFFDKRVPHEYKANSRSVRLEILAGLIDTDGSFDGGGYDFISKIAALADDVAFLARSLGLAAYVKPCIKSYQNGTQEAYYRVSISGDCSIIPVRLPRKKAPARRINKDVLKVEIEVVSIGKGDYYGFNVDGNHLFCLGDFTVTHNSTVPELVVYGIYGKPIKRKITQKTIINNKSKGDLHLEIRWDDYKVIRTRTMSGGTLELWEVNANGVWFDRTAGAGAPETQRKIEALIGMNYRTFVNLLLFNDNNSDGFLESDAAGKRELVENLMSIDKYRLYSEMAKKLVKDATAKTKAATEQYQILCFQVKACKERLATIDEQESAWRNKLRNELEGLKLRIKDLGLTLKTSDTGKALVAYLDAQDEIAQLAAQIPNWEADQDKHNADTAAAREKLNKADVAKGSYHGLLAGLRQKTQGLIADMHKIEDEIGEMENLEAGVQCNQCYSKVDPVNFDHLIVERKGRLALMQVEKKTMKDETEEKSIKLNQAVDFFEKVNLLVLASQSKVQNCAAKVRDARNKLIQLHRVAKPNAESDVLLVQQQVEGLKNQARVKAVEVNGTSPFGKIRAEATQEHIKKTEEYLAKKIEIHESEQFIPYYKYWVDAFSDTGIRKYVIDGIIPALNDRVAYWLNFLIYGNITLTFDNELNETIKRIPEDGDPFIYQQMSGGEQRRLNLAVTMAFAHVMMLSSGTTPSVVFLDEVAINIDDNGIDGIYAMIRELSTDRQVFVTDHNPLLLDLLQHDDCLMLERKDRFTKKVG